MGAVAQDLGKGLEPTICVGYVEFIFKAYGYCLEQALTAEFIQREIPEFEWPMKRATLLFDNGNHKACDKTASVLRDRRNDDRPTRGAVAQAGSVLPSLSRVIVIL